MRAIALFCIKVYRKISLCFPSRCRYYPSCSSYAQEAFRRYSFLKAAFVSAKRIARCHPFAAGGWDPLDKTNQ